MLFYPLKDALKKVICSISTVWLCVIEGKYCGQKQDILISSIITFKLQKSHISNKMLDYNKN